MPGLTHVRPRGAARRATPRAVFAAALGAAAAIAFGAGCQKNESLINPYEALSGSVTTPDTTVLAGVAFEVAAEVEYRSGPGAPSKVVWSVSDGSVLKLATDFGRTVEVSGLKRGEAFVIAFMNDRFRDSAKVTVFAPGDVKWRTPIQGTSLSSPALDLDGNSYIAEVGHGLAVIEPDGSLFFRIDACAGELAPSVLETGSAYLTGDGCAEERAPDGGLGWSVGFGSADGGPAVAADGSALVLHAAFDGGAGVGGVMLSRIAGDGNVTWQDTLVQLTAAADLEPQHTAPAIAGNGDIYVALTAFGADSNWVARVASDGTVRWLKKLAAQSFRSSPALATNRVVVSQAAGVTAFDTLGAIVYDKSFATGGVTSSPVVDDVGNVYVQSAAALVSYGPDGAARWSADSLACAYCDAATGIGAPTLLADGSLVVACGTGAGGGAVCEVDGADGSRIWRDDPGGQVFGAPAVDIDGTIYVTVAPSSGGTDLVALWGGTPPMAGIWPTEGGGMGRLRRR